MIKYINGDKKEQGTLKKGIKNIKIYMSIDKIKDLMETKEKITHLRVYLYFSVNNSFNIPIDEIEYEQGVELNELCKRWLDKQNWRNYYEINHKDCINFQDAEVDCHDTEFDEEYYNEYIKPLERDILIDNILKNE